MTLSKTAMLNRVRITDNQFIEVLRFMNRTKTSYRVMAEATGVSEDLLYSALIRKQSIARTLRDKILQYCEISSELYQESYNKVFNPN